jgi:hypothetical protein
VLDDEYDPQQASASAQNQHLGGMCLQGWHPLMRRDGDAMRISLVLISLDCSESQNAEMGVWHPRCAMPAHRFSIIVQSLFYTWITIYLIPF